MTRDRSVLVRLRASVSEFTGPLKDAKRAVDDVTSGTKDAQRGLAQHARENREAWTTTGAALTTYGAAVTGLGAAVLGVGISYNTLRQRSVAALTTLTGSAEAANAQMDKLDDFASNSPFSRSTFIEAQQQLLGFGMAADDVLPTLDAIQNAVAAFGGSNQDIAELAFIIAQVGAAGKITGQDLMQFGQRGVDAATLIGEQMGYTGAEIREQITAGTLDADAAIRALTDGMQERFGGAAANVKDTFDGAADRVKAAFRDIGASFANVLVDPNGGGLLVDGFNRLADAMRWFLDLPGPIRNTVGALAGLSGVASLAAGGFMMLAPRAVETWDALSKMGRFGSTAQGALRGVGRAAALAAGPAMLGLLLTTLSKIGQGMLDTGESANELENRLRQMSTGESIDSLILGADGIDNFNEALQGIADPSLWGRIDNGVDDFFNGIFAVVTAGHDGRDAVDQFRQSLPALDDALSQMATKSLPDAAQGFRDISEAWDLDSSGMTALLNTLPGFRDHLIGVANDMGIAATDANLLKIATGELVPVTEDAAGAVDELSGAFVRIDPSILQGKADEIRAANAEILQSFVDLSQDIGNQEVSLDAWWASIEEQFEAQAAWADNIAYLRGQGMNEAFVQGLIEQGPAGAMRTQQIVDAMTGGSEANAEWLARGQEYADNLHGGAQATLDGSDPLIMRAEAQAEAQQIADEKARLNEIFYRDPATVPVEADAAEAEQSVHDLILWAAEQTGIVGLDADDTDAIMKIDQWNALANNTEGLPTLNADPALAEVQLAAWLHDANIARATSTLDADASPARGEFDVWYRKADTATATSTLDANNSPAIGANNAWERDGNNSSATATLSANTSRAYSALWAFARAAANTSVSIGLSASGGHAAGGYTGFGGKYEERGIVHASEFVHTKENTSKPGMLGFHYDLWASNDLDAAYARYKMRGYANGGLVGGSPSWTGQQFSSSSPDVSTLSAQVAALSRAVAAIPDRIVVPVSVGAQPVALATRQGNHELGARTAGADAPIYGSRRFP